MTQLAARGRAAYDSDVAVARAQYNVIRLAADLERLGEPWQGVAALTVRLENAGGDRRL